MTLLPFELTDVLSESSESIGFCGCNLDFNLGLYYDSEEQPESSSMIGSAMNRLRELDSYERSTDSVTDEFEASDWLLSSNFIFCLAAREVKPSNDYEVFFFGVLFENKASSYSNLLDASKSWFDLFVVYFLKNEVRAYDFTVFTPAISLVRDCLLSFHSNGSLAEIRDLYLLPVLDVTLCELGLTFLMYALSVGHPLNFMFSSRLINFFLCSVIGLPLAKL